MKASTTELKRGTRKVQEELDQQQVSEITKESAEERSHGVMRPLVQMFADFSDSNDLANRTRDLYARLKHLTAEDSMLAESMGRGSQGATLLNFYTLQAGLKQLGLKTPIHLQADDFEILTCGRTLCNSATGFTVEQWHCMLLLELKRSAQRGLTTAMMECSRHGKAHDTSILRLLKFLDLSVDAIEANTDLLHLGSDCARLSGSKALDGQTSRKMISPHEAQGSYENQLDMRQMVAALTQAVEDMATIEQSLEDVAASCQATHRHTLYVLNGDLVANFGEELHRAVDANLNTLRMQGAEDSTGGRRKGGPQNVRGGDLLQ